MTINDYKTQLHRLHNEIKDNPFRINHEINAKYGQKYFETVYKFAETFYHLTKDIQKGRIENITNDDKMLAKVAEGCLFTHDFYACVNRSENAIISYNDYGKTDRLNIVHEEEELVELCISCVHCYIDTGLFYRFPFKYKGSIKWAEWNAEQNDYVINFSK